MHKGLKWAIALSVVLALVAGGLFLTLRKRLVATPPPGASSPEAMLHTQRAAAAVRLRDMALARQELRDAFAAQPAYAPALLVQACIALEEGDVTVLENSLDQLQDAAPQREEPQFLRKLMEHRRGSTGPGWRQAFLSAWAELGRPSFSDSPLLPESEEGVKPKDLIPAAAWEHATTTPTRLVLTLASAPLTEEQARWLLEQIPSMEDAAWVYAVDDVLRADGASGALRAEATPVLRHRLEQVVQAAPDVIQPRLRLLLGNTDEDAAFSAQELDSLEQIAALPVWRNTSFRQTFLAAREHLKEVGVPTPGTSAFSVAVEPLATIGLHLLRTRAEATRSQLLPGARYKLGHILWRVGLRVSEGSTILEHIVGNHLMVEGAEDMQDPVERNRVAGLRDEAIALVKSSHQAAADKWPLPSMAEEMLEAAASDELAHLRAFAEPLPEHASP